jgi:ATP-dependent Clp protease ATP-binding subunit ClpA
MPKINVYLPDELATAVREANVPVSAVCQVALERAVRDITAARGTEATPSGELPDVGLYSRFTPRAREAITLAQQAARTVPHNYVGTEHILLGVLDQGTNVAVKVLSDLGINLSDLRSELQGAMGPAAGAFPPADLPYTPLARRALELTTSEALRLGHNYIGCEHLLLGLIGTEDGLAGKVLRRFGVELRTTRQAIVTALVAFVTGQQRSTGPASPASAATLEAAATPSEATLARILERLDAIERRLAS